MAAQRYKRLTRERGPAVARVRLGELPLPLRIEQVPVALRHLGLRVGQHHGGVRRGRCGKRKGRERGRDERENQEASAQRPWPKLHILFPRKFSGIAAAIEIACAATFGTPRPLMSSSSIASENRNASTLTTKKRTAWKPA